MTKPRESRQVRETRDRRAAKLRDAVIEWQRLAQQRQFPLSLHDILFAALTHEAAVARRKRR